MSNANQQSEQLLDLIAYNTGLIEGRAAISEANHIANILVMQAIKKSKMLISSEITWEACCLHMMGKSSDEVNYSISQLPQRIKQYNKCYQNNPGALSYLEQIQKKHFSV